MDPNESIDDDDDDDNDASLDPRLTSRISQRRKIDSSLMTLLRHTLAEDNVYIICIFSF